MHEVGQHATALLCAETATCESLHSPSHAIGAAPTMVADGRRRIPTTWVQRSRNVHHTIRVRADARIDICRATRVLACRDSCPRRWRVLILTSCRAVAGCLDMTLDSSSSCRRLRTITLDSDLVWTSFLIVRDPKPPARHVGSDSRHFYFLTLTDPTHLSPLTLLKIAL